MVLCYYFSQYVSRVNLFLFLLTRFSLNILFIFYKKRMAKKKGCRCILISYLIYEGHYQSVFVHDVLKYIPKKKRALWLLAHHVNICFDTIRCRKLNSIKNSRTWTCVTRNANRYCVCVFVCACICVRAHVCVCVCVRLTGRA